MNNEIIEQESWWKRNWKWSVPVIGIGIIFIFLFYYSSMDDVTTNLVQAYTDTELYENALKKVRANEKASYLLGEIQPIDKLAILEGQIEYTNNNKTVNSSIRIVGTKGKANLDISANRVADTWNYTKINIRIKTPLENRQTIDLLIRNKSKDSID